MSKSEHRIDGFDTPIFHLTAIKNLQSICWQGALLSKSEMTSRKIPVQKDLSNPNIQKGRKMTEVHVTGGVLHDYVPFYFAPRSPLMYGFNDRGIDQTDYAYIYTTVAKVVDNNLVFSFTDMHPLTPGFRFFQSINDLNKLNWKYFFEKPTLSNANCPLPMSEFCKYFNDEPARPNRDKIRMAEFLVKTEFPLRYACGVAVADNGKRSEVCNILSSEKINLPVSVVPGWYFQ